MGAVHGIPQTITEVTSHWWPPQINHDAKSKPARITKCDRASTCCSKNGANRFVWHRVATNLQFEKNKTHNICKVE